LKSFKSDDLFQNLPEVNNDESESIHEDMDEDDIPDEIEDIARVLLSGLRDKVSDLKHCFMMGHL